MYRDPEKNAGGQIPGPNTSPTAAPVANDEAKADQEKAAALKASEAAKVAEGAPVNAETKKGLNEMLKEMDLEKMFGDIIKSLSEAFQELAKALGGLAPSLAAAVAPNNTPEATPKLMKDQNIMSVSDTSPLITAMNNFDPFSSDSREALKSQMQPYENVTIFVGSRKDKQAVEEFRSKHGSIPAIAEKLKDKQFIDFELPTKIDKLNIKTLNEILDKAKDKKVAFTGPEAQAMALMMYMKNHPTAMLDDAIKVNNLDKKTIAPYEGVIDKWLSVTFPGRVVRPSQAAKPANNPAPTK